ncbi:hypothetical protein QEH59_15305 [Coraliomargarita sp. SDUM461004]|uniref:WYL domain-containing protein n=2 Tax=Thalassobacterium sedimentorum TaxID=3041258 RepID=A0ABU1AMA3_9BACT|nr:hypothetical protein [Coraliomargarita sp. SDUM461004]
MGMDRTIAGWSEKQRLLFIERLLYWRGSINRRDLCEHFGISLPQATKDLVSYTTLNSGACQYDVRRKCYVAAAKMQTVLREPNFSEDMEVVGAAMRDGLEFGEFVLGGSRPRRVADLALHRKLSLAACNQECVEAAYWSVKSGSSETRWLSPRGFGFDGLRWHVRAYCHRSELFKDFVIGRFQTVGRRKPCLFEDLVDVDWLETETLTFRPNPELSKHQRTALEMDYGMESGRLQLAVRRAMRIYALRRLGFVQEPLEPPMLNELQQLEWFGRI